MDKRNSLVVLPVFFFVFLLVSGSAQSVKSDQNPNCSSISSILSSKEACDNKTVVLQGTVRSLDLKIAKNGNKYAVFSLADDSDEITVYSSGYPSISYGDRVRVEGVYHRQWKVAGNVFFDEIETKDYRVTVVTPLVPSWAYLLFFVIGIGYYSAKKIQEKNSYRKGRDFEDYTISLFDEKEWVIDDRSSDTSKRVGRKIVGDLGYDLIVKHKSNKRFILQCKYRSNFFKGKKGYGIEWAKEYQIENYTRFGEDRNLSYYVIIGVGGKPKKPEHLFLIPLDRLRYTFADKDYLRKFERDKKDKFNLERDFGMSASPPE